MHIYEIFTLLSFYEELCMFYISPKVLVIGPLFFYVQIYFSIYFENLVHDFSDYLVENEQSKTSM